jgi:hypothetical protein
MLTNQACDDPGTLRMLANVVAHKQQIAAG